VGKVFRVLIDREEGEYFAARTEYDSPEVDNEVLIPKSPKIKQGKFYDVKIISAAEFELYGEIIS